MQSLVASQEITEYKSYGRHIEIVPGICLFMEFNSFSLIPKCPSEISSSYLLVRRSLPEHNSQNYPSHLQEPKQIRNYQGKLL